MDGSAIGQTDSHRVAASELRAFVERIERLRAEIADLKDMEKEVFAELVARLSQAARAHHSQGTRDRPGQAGGRICRFGDVPRGLDQWLN